MSNEATPLDNILNDEPVEEAVVAEPTPVEPAPVEAEKAEPERDDAGRFAAKKGVEAELETDPEAVPPTDQLPQAEYKAIREEREKRQALEAELETLRKANQQPPEQPKPQEPAPDMWGDTEKWQQHFGGQMVTTAVQQATLEARLDMSEMLTRQAHDDFEQVKGQFLDLMKSNPALQQQALADPHPWEKAYSLAKNHAAIQEMGAVDMADLEAKMREKVMAEFEAQASPAATAPPSLSGERNVGSRSGPAWSGPKPLGELLG